MIITRTKTKKRISRARSDIISRTSTREQRPGDENALQHILSAFCQRVFHPSACEALAGVLLRIVYRNNPRDCKALIELEAPNRIAAAVHSQVRVWMCPQRMFVFGDTEETEESDAKTKCARACAELARPWQKKPKTLHSVSPRRVLRRF